jgi:hypothetical protein
MDLPAVARDSTQITYPQIIPDFNKDEYISLNPSGDQIYTLSQITEAGGTIHKWYESKNRYDEMSFLVFRVLSPVDLIITDSSNRMISKSINEIRDGTYTERDMDADGEMDDEVIIPEPLDGQYQIQVVPEPDALSTDTYTQV